MHRVITNTNRRRPTKGRAFELTIVLVVGLICYCALLLYKKVNSVQVETPASFQNNKADAVFIDYHINSQNSSTTSNILTVNVSTINSKTTTIAPGCVTEQDGSTNFSQKVVRGLETRKVQKPTGFNGGAMEQIACMMMSVSDEVGMPPTPLAPEETLRRDFMKAITNDIIVYEDDEAKVVEFKENVADMKNQLAGILEAKGSLTAALREYEQWVNENKEIRDGVIAQYHKLLTEATSEEAQAYLDAANAELKTEGITPISLNLRDRIKLRKLSRIKESTDTNHEE